MAAAERLAAAAALIGRAVADTDALVAQAPLAASRLRATPTDRLVAFGCGALLHAFYTEVEKALVRVARDLDGFEPRGESWHADLLVQMTLEVAGLRPGVLSATAHARLLEYLRFRHLFRNLYVLDLDAERLATLLEALPGVWTDLRVELSAFADALRGIGRGLSGAG